MQRLTTLALAATGLFALSIPAQEGDKPKPKPDDKPKTLKLGERPNGQISLKDIDGKPVYADALQGKITVVNFWSITCPIQKGWEERLKKITAEYGKKDVQFFMINANEGNGEIADKVPEGDDGKAYKTIRDYMEKNGMSYRVLIDHGHEVADLFGAKTTPDIFVFDKTGKLTYRGLISNDYRKNKGEDEVENYLTDTLDKLLQGEAVEPFETPPAGCSIKRVRKDADDKDRGRERGQGTGGEGSGSEGGGGR